MSKKIKIDQLRLLLKKDVLLNAVEKDRLIQNLELLPVQVIDDLTSQIRKHIDVYETYLETAIEEDPQIVDEMKSKVRSLEREFNKLVELEQSGDVEEELEEQLKDV